MREKKKQTERAKERKRNRQKEIGKGKDRKWSRQKAKES